MTFFFLFFFYFFFLFFSSFHAFLSCLFLFFLSFPSLCFPFSSLFRFSPLFFPFLYLLFFVSFSPIDLCLSCVCVVIDTTCNIYVVVSLGWQSEYLVSPGVSSETYAPAWTWHIVDWLPISLLYVSGGGVSCDKCVYHLGLCVFSLGYSSAPEWLEPVLWPRTWLCEIMWEQQQVSVSQSKKTLIDYSRLNPNLASSTHSRKWAFSTRTPIQLPKPSGKTTSIRLDASLELQKVEHAYEQWMGWNRNSYEAQASQAQLNGCFAHL